MMLEYSPRSHPIQVSICLGTHREPALRRIRSQASTFRDRQLLQTNKSPVSGGRSIVGYRSRFGFETRSGFVRVCHDFVDIISVSSHLVYHVSIIKCLI